MRDCLKIQLNLRIEVSEKVESNGFHLERGAISEVTILFLTRSKDQSRKKGYSKHTERIFVQNTDASVLYMM